MTVSHAVPGRTAAWGRRLLRTPLPILLPAVLVMAACGGDDAEPETAPDASRSAELQELVAAADGQTLNIISQATADYERFVTSFQDAFPEINVELTASRPSEIAPRIVSEQAAGVYEWDVMVGGTSNMVNVLLPADAFQELPPFVSLDGITDDAAWGGGFDYYATDTPHVLVTAALNTSATFVNRDVLPEAEFDSLDDLAKPELAGKIVADDCTVPAHGIGALVSIDQAAGRDAVETLLGDQEVTFLNDFLAVSEAVARGDFGVAIGADQATITDLQRDGIGANTELVPMPDGAVNLTTTGLAVFTEAPNEDATRLFVNWALSAEGQEAFVQAYAAEGRATNSRRLDVTVGDPSTRPAWESLDAADLHSWTTATGSAGVREIIALCEQARGL